MEQIHQICDDIYTITGIKAVFYDANLELLYSHPESMGLFCTYVRQEERLTERCLSCDRAGFSQCRNTGEQVIYRCHMGLTEAVSPVQENGRTVGYILFGQMLSAGDRGKVEEVLRTGNYRNPERLLQALETVPVIEESVIRASARLICMCASSVQLKNILKLRREGAAARLDGYISEHLADPALSLGTLCKVFGMSRGLLYSVSKQAFGVGITEYIRSKRLHRAIAMIRQGSLPIYRIAEETGFSDANYLSKLVKKETGCTPKQLQKINRV